jgi:hypothetical protein
MLPSTRLGSRDTEGRSVGTPLYHPRRKDERDDTVVNRSTHTYQLLPAARMHKNHSNLESFNHS